MKKKFKYENEENENGKNEKEKKVPMETRKKEEVGVEWSGAAVTLLFTPRRHGSLLELTPRP